MNTKTALELVKLFLDHGASIKETLFNEGKSNALTVALLNDHEEVVVELMERLQREGVDGDIITTDDETILPKAPVAVGNWKDFAEKRGMKKVLNKFSGNDNQNSTKVEPISE